MTNDTDLTSTSESGLAADITADHQRHVMPLMSGGWRQK